MKRQTVLFCLASIFVVLSAGCGGAPKTANDDLSGYFPEKIDAVALQKGSEVRTFVGDSLWQYIDGGAELYHTYGFVKVSMAYYQSKEVELLLDLYQFNTADGAYGLYSALRPETPSLVPLGVEGYVTASSLEFVRGDIMVRVMAYEASNAITSAMLALAERVAAGLPGTTQRPGMFARFPVENAVTNTDKIVGASFLGQSFLNMIYTRDYQFDQERVTLFLAADTLGAGFADWLLASGDTAKAAGKATGLQFDEGYCLLIANNYYGNVVAGLKGGKLAGMVNYTDRRLDFVDGWLESLGK